MTGAVVDTTILYAAANRRASRHEVAFRIVSEADNGLLPTLVVPDPILVETMNGLTRDVGPDTATDVFDRLQRSNGFDLQREPAVVWTSGLDTFERFERLSLADAVLVASASHRGLEFCYSFDTDFDGIDGLTRLSTAHNPMEPD